MAPINFLVDGARTDAPTLVFAHGAGMPMDAPYMNTVAQGLAQAGLRVVRFEFAYMAQRRTGGSKRPPPKMPLLQEEYHAALSALARDVGADGPIVIGGKSMGGRVASLIADDLHAARHIRGVLCLGYPFHPQGKPDVLRVDHLEALLTPTLMCQGTRDPFGTEADVATYPLSPQIEMAWFEDGDHDLKPRKRVTGLDHAAHLAQFCEIAGSWVKERCAG
ncbi:alpha/beta family hydrolase [Shimia sp. MMG029]|uniref:alpha/beta family hydrolase n=1 Tax=Shimia sp. MMG029 TaxID=3021978 RepID=UPI0022FE7001|nr:alpha/beta family hydrolase [Shimia sp. MMG029]MDA5558280.1 alpha/beta hydrolase [Shimia sp. MMG029]